MKGDEMRWDLSQLVESTDPVSIQKRLDSMVSTAGKTRVKFHGKIGDLSADGVLELLETLDGLRLQFEGAVKYCFLMYYADSTDTVAKQLNDAARRAFMKVEQALAFVDIELGRLFADNPALLLDPVLAEYKHHLERILRRVPHMLSETEERLIIAKDKNGISAWEMLQSDWLSTRTFEIEVEGVKKTLPYGKIIGFYQSPDRDLRKRANQVVYEGLGKDEIVWASAIRSVCEDHMQMVKLRKHQSAMTQSLISNDVDQQTIDSLMKTIEKNANLYQKYLTLKARLMGLGKLANYDLVAPLPNAPGMEYNWEESQREITDSYRGFDTQMGDWIEEMYEKRHIDGESFSLSRSHLSKSTSARIIRILMG